MLDNPTVSVAVFTFNRNDDLERCLEALGKQTYVDFDIIVVNGGQCEGVKKVVDLFPTLRVRIVNQERKGLVEARNLGWIHSRADIACLIDDDLKVAPDWLENVRACFLQDENIGGVSGPTIIPQDCLKNRDLASFLGGSLEGANLVFRMISKLYISLVLENKTSQVGRILKSGAFTPGSNFISCLSLTGIEEVDYLEACHMCFRRRLLEELGGFDYGYTGTSEWSEPDFSFRVRKHGWKLVFNPKAVTYHYISQGGVFKARTNSYERSRNFILFYLRWIKPDNPEKILRFGINLFFINAYWCYKFLQSANPDWLRGVVGTLDGLLGVKYTVKA